MDCCNSITLGIRHKGRVTPYLYILAGKDEMLIVNTQKELNMKSDGRQMDVRRTSDGRLREVPGDDLRRVVWRGMAVGGSTRQSDCLLAELGVGVEKQLGAGRRKGVATSV